MHTEKERVILTYIGSDLLNLALKYGYRIHACHEVWGWKQCAPIFADMIAELLIDKLCASSFDKLGLSLLNNDDERQQFIDDFCRRLGLPVRRLHSRR